MANGYTLIFKTVVLFHFTFLEFSKPLSFTSIKVSIIKQVLMFKLFKKKMKFLAHTTFH